MNTQRNRKQKFTESTGVHIRWMIRRDMPEVLAIETAVFEFPESEDEFIQRLRQRNCIGMVAVNDCERIVGFMLYELHRTRIHVLNFAVHPHCQREGVGAAMVAKLRGKLAPTRRTRITCAVRETNLRMCLFMRSMDFRATKVIPDYYDLSPEDAYLFEHRLEGKSC